jgi:Bacterial SH3 domain
MKRRVGFQGPKEGAGGMIRFLLAIAAVLALIAPAALIADFLGARLTPTAAAQTVTPVSPGQAPPASGTVTPVGPPPSSPVQPVTPHPSGTVTPVNPAQSPSSTAQHAQVVQIAPPRLMWLRKDLRLREQPGLAGRQIGVVRAGSAVPVVGEVVGQVDGYRWYQVEAAGTRGFIAAIDLSTQPVN